MADRYLIETSTVDGYLLEDGTGVLLLEGGVAQTLEPGLFTNTQTFHSPTVSATYSLTAGLFTNSQTFHAATVSPGPVDLSPSLLTNSQSFHAPTVSSTYALTPSLFTNSQSFFAPTVTPGPVTLAPALFANSQAFHLPTISASYTLQPALLENAATFYGAAITVSFDQTVALSLLMNVPVFFWPLVTTASASWAVQSPVAVTWTVIPDPEVETWT